ncbi:MAG: DUF502 domain-containing protein [Alphaproteobacteria bacterium]|nr:DUF502 domain-containing protein [Alphaproteobacteria bacterium]
MTTPASPSRFNPFAWLSNSFAAGVALVLPFVVTVWLVWTVVGFIDKRVMPLLPGDVRPYAELVPGTGVIIALISLTLVGALAGNLIGRAFVRLGERFMLRLPLVSAVYGGSKQIFKQVAAPQRTSFKEAVLVEFPQAGHFAIGFITNEDTIDIVGQDDPLVAVYLPQAPIPTSGFLIYAPRSRLRPIPMGPDEALKRVISLGIVRKEDEPDQR